MGVSVIQEFIFGLGFAKISTKALTDAEKKAKATADKMAKDMKKASDDVIKAWKDAGKSIASSLAIAGAAATAAAFGIFKFTESTATAGDEIAKASRNLGISTQAFQEFSFASKIAGTGASGFKVAIQRMQKGLNDARQTGVGPFADRLEQLGIGLEELDNQDPGQIFERLADGIGEATDKTTKASAAQDFFGRGGKTLLPLLNEKAAGIQRLRARFRELSDGFTEDGALASEAFADAMVELETVVDSVKIAIGVELMPTVQGYIDSIRDWVMANKPLLKQKLREFIDRIFSALKQLIPAVLELAPALLRIAELGIQLVSAMGPAGATGALIGLRAAMAGSLGPAGLLATALAVVVTALINVVAKAQDAEFAINDLLQGGRGARGAGAKGGGTKRSAQLTARLSSLNASRKQTQALLRQSTIDEFKGGGLTDKKRSLLQAQLAANTREIARTTQKLKTERTKSRGLVIGAPVGKTETTEEREQRIRNEQFDIDFPIGPKEKKKPKKGGGGGTKKTPEELAAEAQSAEFFGAEVNRLGASAGATDIAIEQSLAAGAASLGRGDSRAVARKAVLSRLGASVGKEFGGKETDPLLSAIFGEDVPDARLSQVALGAQPQTLIATINNTFSFDIDQEINGAGNPADVASQINRGIRNTFEDAIAKSTKLAKVRFRR